ncbi:DNA ligase [Vibrio sp. 99-70-13A1]|uniref:DNA ligase n=1 Tax=Vibrio sp. 99-70-13A1 TaxID=2607601 RepID=UPI001493647B|nr:DNA ligase [Vibrio sp. 99-70-13A1]NOH96358.1 DNA ligase [Vibrio sp. 99-70-13A1]
MKLTQLAIATCLSFPSYASQSYLPPESLVLANQYEQGVNVDEYWKSEKLDGVRAVWDGAHLYTRNGNRIYAPSWFTQNLPNVRLEGELWAGRGKFHIVQSTVLDQTPDDDAWKTIDLMLFDMPGAAGDYQKRYYNILHWVAVINEDHIKYVTHTPISSEKVLFQHLDNIGSEEGEGLMLRKVSSRYQAGRSNDLLKLKQHHDAEAVILGYKGGTGKYKGMMGSVLVKTDEGAEFYIGSGFTDDLRLSPPEIGSTITFRYNGFTQNGIPKFARFVRQRNDY